MEGGASPKTNVTARGSSGASPYASGVWTGVITGLPVGIRNSAAMVAAEAPTAKTHAFLL
jgi:hypothetical protein